MEIIKHTVLQDAAHIPVSIMKFSDKHFTCFIKFQFQGLFIGYQHLTPLKAALIQRCNMPFQNISSVHFKAI